MIQEICPWDLVDMHESGKNFVPAFHEMTLPKVGDLVTPMSDEEFLFMDGGMDHEVDPIECVWSDVVGVVLEVSDFDPAREYKRIRVMIMGHIGWTYSDYVQIISS